MTRLKLYIRALLLAAIAGLASCSNSDLWDELPQKVTDFINQYFPNSELQSVNTGTTGVTVRIDNGPGMSFDTDSEWTDINGYGMPLPQVLLYDQLPEKLYDYLQETENMGSVFQLSRKGKIYTVRLLNSSLTFDSANGSLSGTGYKGMIRIRCFA